MSKIASALVEKMRRNLHMLWKTACLFLVAFSILVSFSHFTNRPVFGKPRTNILSFSSEATNQTSSTHETLKESESSLKDGNSTLLEIAPSYIKAILHPEDKSFPRLECPPPEAGRYQYLLDINTNTSSSRTPLRYFFALDLHQCASILPRLMGSIVETMRFLGPENCALSIVEGRSDDGTFEILKLLRAEIEEIGGTYFLNSSDLEPGAAYQERIQTLAELRNRALEPLTQQPDQYSLDTTIVFLNDVTICMEDILELIHQRQYQKADMTCAMDWVYLGQDPTFYDVWIARGMNGDTFFNIPADGNWNFAWNLFWNNPMAKERLNAHKPFQVFSCWNGATAFTAKPILEHKIKFRGPTKEECYQGEPKLFCKDMWHIGYGKIAVVPSISLEYSDDGGRKIKALKGYTSDLVNKNGDNDDPSTKIQWETSPPAQVKCMPSYGDQTWHDWNEALRKYKRRNITQIVG